jgi:hypothetical protein
MTKAVNEGADDNSLQRKAEENDAGTKIAASIKTLSDAQSTQTAHEDRNESINVVLAAVTIFLVFSTVVFTGLSWWTFHNQLKEMKSSAEQTNKIIEANTKLAEAAAKQADAASENAQTARDSYLASQRAWVGPRNAKIAAVPVADKDLPIVLEYGNTGREPAVETVYDVDAFTATEDEDNGGKTAQRINAFIKTCIAMWKPDEASVVYPSAGLSANYVLTKTLDKSFIDDDVVSGNKIIILSGCFVCKTSQSIHRSWFCYFYKANKTEIANWNICKTGNNAD